MSSKLCKKCKIEKPLSEFHKRSKNKDGLYSYCHECSRADANTYYAKNRNKYIIRSAESHPKLRHKRKLFLQSIRCKYGCQLCGEKDSDVLDFHHADPSKKLFNVTWGADVAVSRFIEEINKCIVLCANCHRRVHAGTREINQEMLCKEEIPEREDGKARPDYSQYSSTKKAQIQAPLAS